MSLKTDKFPTLENFIEVIDNKLLQGFKLVAGRFGNTEGKICCAVTALFPNCLHDMINGGILYTFLGGVWKGFDNEILWESENKNQILKEGYWIGRKLREHYKSQILVK